MTSRLSFMAVVLALLTACANTTMAPAVSAGVDGQVPNANQLLGQLSLPPGARLLSDQSLIIGSGDNWVGRVVLDVGRNPDTAYGFFLESYPPQGWAVVSAVRGKTSLLVLTRQERTATVELIDGGLLGTSQIVLTMAPRNATVMLPKKP
ncbi:hypothetical protein B9Z38_11260 [Limnohabitans sp. MMS-10A-160]|jgi:hypothetical protein|uniref:hypothetical protein n=1 Tax=unclassified Limnohabitans TaxID=2626134 RepID=UPI000D390095|nr:MULTISPECIES: hypothetical protein [unclassified Limnohabitans]PUE18899.1 hypothetical protein B9Z43_09470 [Limnohabitans sp. MMS-10A-192]PUE24495.1 hypothetical protein B9Z38_11260 [Limnohabitans sp. MMS-10A-160]